MEPNNARAEAERWIGISAKLLSTRDLVGSRSFALRAKDADPHNPFPDQILAVVDTLAAAEKRVISSTHYDWYSILNLSHLARDPDLISSQYRRLVFLLNPDHNRFPFADFALRLVVDAWSVLSDPTKKWIYDSELSIFLQRSNSAESVRVDSAATYQFFQPEQPPPPQQHPPPQQQWIHQLQQDQLQERQLFQQQHSQTPPQQHQWLPQPDPEPQPPPRPQQQPHWPPHPEPEAQPPSRPQQQPHWPPQPEAHPPPRTVQQPQWMPQPEPQTPPRAVQQPQWMPQLQPEPQPPAQQQPQWLPQPNPPAPPQQQRPAKPKEPQFPAQLPQRQPPKPKEPQFPVQLPQRLPEQHQSPRPKEPQIQSHPPEQQWPSKPKEPPFPAQLPQRLPEQQQPPRPKEPQFPVQLPQRLPEQHQSPIPKEPPHQPPEQQWPSKPKEPPFPAQLQQRLPEQHQSPRPKERPIASEPPHQPSEQQWASKPKEPTFPAQLPQRLPEQQQPPRPKEPQISSKPPEQHRPAKPREQQVPSQLPMPKEPQLPPQPLQQEPRQAPSPRVLPVHQPIQQEERDRQDGIGREGNVASAKGAENVNNKDSFGVGGNHDVGGVDVGADGQVESFWTGCPYCYHLYEYLKVYQDCTLRCQNCRRGFHALEVPKPPSIAGGGKEGTFCSWSFFPLGFSMTAWKKSAPFGGDAKGPASSWVPFSPMFACPVQPPKQKVGRRLYKDDDFDVSDPSEDSDSSQDWGSTRKRKKRQDSGRGRRGRGGRKSNAERERVGNQVSGGVNAENLQNSAEVQRNVNHEAVRTKNDVINKVAGGGNVRKQMGKGVRGRKKLDLNVEFSNEVDDHANAVNAGNGEEVVGFFEGLDEFLSTLPILHAVGDDKAKPS